MIRPFQPEKFNFTKIAPSEVLAVFNDTAKGFDVTITKGDETGFDAQHQLVINASPLAVGHGLFVPDIKGCNPQVITKTLLGHGVSLLQLIDASDAKLGFNSLGAYASVNHFHLHLLFTKPDFNQDYFPIEQAKVTKMLWDDQGVCCLLTMLPDSGNPSSLLHNVLYSSYSSLPTLLCITNVR